MKQLLFGSRDPEKLYQETIKHADLGLGGRQAMADYYFNADEIAEAYEEDRHIDLVTSCLNFKDYHLLVSGQVDLVLDQDGFDTC